MPGVYWVQQSSCRDIASPHEVPPGPWVKIGMDFFQDHHGKKYLIIADYFSKFPYIFPVASGTSFQDHQPSPRTLHSWRHASPLWCLTMALHSMEMNSKGLLESSTSCSPHHHLISTSPMVSSRPWWRRSRTPMRKLMDLQMLKQEHYFKLWDTPISTDLPSPAKILHGWPAQGAVISRPSKLINIHQIHGRDSLKYRTHRRNSLTEHTRAKVLRVLKVNEQVQFFPSKQGMGPLTWWTGTVTEILDCGHSYMIQGPNGRVYRRNRAHLKPICYDGMPFQDHPVKKRKSSLKSTPFKTPSPQRWKTCPSRWTPATWMPDPCYLINLTHIRHTLHHHHHHPSSYTHPGCTIISTSCISDHPENHQ